MACAKGRVGKPAEKRRRNRRDCKLGLSDRIPLSKLSSKQFEIEIETEPTLRNRLNWVHISEKNVWTQHTKYDYGKYMYIVNDFLADS